MATVSLFWRTKVSQTPALPRQFVIAWRHWLVALALLLVATVAAHAQSTRITLQEGDTVGLVTIPVNKSTTVRLDRSFAEALVGSSDIADVLPLTDRSLYVLGRSVGTTNISILNAERRVIGVIEVQVTLDVPTIQRRIHEATGNSSIVVHDDNGHLVLSGAVYDAPSIDRAIQIATQFAPGNVINAMNVTSTQQVLLKVRFVEATRDAGRALGVRWDARGGTSNLRLGRENYPSWESAEDGNLVAFPPGSAPLLQILEPLAGVGNPFGVAVANLVNRGFQLDVMIQALEQKGLVRNLAEPNLVAMSGDTASFLAGGEFPFQVATARDEAPAVQFKEFGVRLSFTPTVLRNGHVNLVLEPEVSALGAMTPSGPVINTRRARTTIELRDGQSFAIAGMFQTQSDRQIDQVPWLGSIPILGALFRSTGFQNFETDLVIIVTPHLVQPGTPENQIATPLDRSLPANDPDLFLMGQLEVPKEYRHYVEAGVGIQGPYGHLLKPEYGHVGPIGKSDYYGGK